MKNSDLKILAASLLLMTFILGQVIVFAHSHKNNVYEQINTHHKKEASADSKCSICDQNSHVQLFLQLHHHIFYSKVACSFHYPVFVPGYQSVKLLISGNKGPPLS